MIAAKPPMILEPDPLTEILEVFPLPLRFAGRFHLTAPWGLSLPERSAAVCAVSRGRCWLTARGSEGGMSVAAGEIIVLSPACEHELRDACTSRVVPIGPLIDRARAERRTVLGIGGEGPATTLVGGVFGFDECRAHPLCSTLPPALCLRQDEGGETLRLAELAGTLDREASSGQLGRRSIVDRLAEVLFISASRVHFARTGCASNGSLRGMLHPDLAAAMRLIHGQPEKPWTVAGLAEKATMSRSAFSATFTKVLGKPPLQYLRERRMQLACRLLGDSSLGLKEIASRVGYDSVSAFSAAFKRFTGKAPGAYRRRERLSESS